MVVVDSSFLPLTSRWLQPTEVDMRPQNVCLRHFNSPVQFQSLSTPSSTYLSPQNSTSWHIYLLVFHPSIWNLLECIYSHPWIHEYQNNLLSNDESTTSWCRNFIMVFTMQVLRLWPMKGLNAHFYQASAASSVTVTTPWFQWGTIPLPPFSIAVVLPPD